MHEFSIASQILEIARERASERGADRIDLVEVSVGEASHVNPDQLCTCLDAAATETMAAEATFEVTTVAPYAECDCGWTGEPEVLDTALAYAPDLTCPDCDARLDLEEGDGCHLVRLVVPDVDEPQTDTSAAADAQPTDADTEAPNE